MSLLQNIIVQVAQNALTGNQPKPSQDLGGLLGGLTGQSNNALGGLLGQVVASQITGNQAQSGLGGLLGSMLGNQPQKQANPADLGNILGQVLGSQTKKGEFNKSTLLLALLPIVLGYIQSNGGLSGVLTKFQGNGLDKKAQSWVNIDVDNDGIDAGDIVRLFGQDTINQACEQTGASQNDVCQGIAELLPQVMNDLTPHGNVTTDESQANQEIAEILAQFQKAF